MQPIHVKYFLGHWGSWERNHEWLNKQQRINAKRLFSGLQRLTTEDVQLLAEKYRPSAEIHLNGNDVQATDATLAARRGIPILVYRQQRHEAEHRLAMVMVNER